jgi:hypothetical protein
MAEEVVTGEAVHSKAEIARRALFAAQRGGRPAPPSDSDDATDPVEPEPEGVATDDPRIRVLTEEIRTLRRENAELREALRKLRDAAGRALGP